MEMFAEASKTYASRKNAMRVVQKAQEALGTDLPHLISANRKGRFIPVIITSLSEKARGNLPTLINLGCCVC